MVWCQSPRLEAIIGKFLNLTSVSIFCSQKTGVNSMSSNIKNQQQNNKQDKLTSDISFELGV